MMKRKIKGKTTISKPGTYTLAADISKGAGTRISGSCIRIEANDVVLDGAGHTVDGWGISDTIGIEIAGSRTIRNVTVKNVTLTDWNFGVRCRNAANVQIRNVEASKNSYGISFEETRDSSVQGTTATGNLVGVAFDVESRNNEVRDGRIQSNHGTDVLDQADCLE